MIPGSIQIAGADSLELKESRLHDFACGAARVLISKPSIAGFGLNWQHCANMAFVGINDSFESYYQAVRRCYRFGQTKSVNVHVFASSMEGSVVQNIRRKELDAIAMAEQLGEQTRSSVMQEVLATSSRQTNSYKAVKPISIPEFLS
jgi:hypothetical protein